MNSPRNPAVHIALTGAAGQIGYALAFRLASGALFGPQTPIVLHLIEIEPALPALEGVVMELEDCAFPLLQNVVTTSDLKTGFNGVNWALLVGSVPRKAEMQRRDLLEINGKIFIAQGRAIQENAASDARVLVVGNPCNTNCLLARNSAPDMSDERFFAMTRLDENRAKSQLAKKAGASVGEVERLAVWGNHSATMFPHFSLATIGGKPAESVINDADWLRGEFLQSVQNRGTAIIQARGASSAGSAANAILGSVESVISPTHGEDFHSLALPSRGEYGVAPGLIFSYPTRSDGKTVSVVEGLPLDEFAREKVRATALELETEREAVRDLLNS